MLVRIPTGGHVVERIHDEGFGRPELIVERRLGLGANSNAQSIDFQAVIHGESGCGCGLRLEGTYVLFSEQKLPVQIAHFNPVHIHRV